ncbi:MAG: ATP-binding protein [Methanomassiliicoccales archaeon]|nr:MAG: ATP-binding protein [Methanomassiliicoccales archaeon]
MPQTKDILLDSNPWWKDEFEIEYKEREIYNQIAKFKKMPQIVALTGLRRVGKTTLMLKMVEDEIGAGFESKNIIYFSFDEFRKVEIRQILRAYEELTDRDLKKGKFILLFDEIPKLKGWEDQLKRIYDMHGKKVKIIISGSESLFIRKKSKETLAGRIFEFTVNPLSFKEFLCFRKAVYKPIGLYEKELAKSFKEYILTLGFPELVGVKEKDVVKKYVMESIVEKAVYRDIPALFKVRDISVVDSLLSIFMEEPGQLIELNQLSSDIGISRQTLSNYLTYLENSFLIKKLYNFSRSMRKVERKLKKYYPTVISADLAFKEDDHSKSKVLEWLVITQLRAEFFWRDPYKNEVDAVLANKKFIPVEIKYGKVDFGGLFAFMKKFQVDRGYIVSFDRKEKRKINGKTIIISPAYHFLIEHSDTVIH